MSNEQNKIDELDTCPKCGEQFYDILGIGYCWKCFKDDNQSTPDVVSFINWYNSQTLST